MKKYYALDYVNKLECELVYNDQLYLTEEEAEAARSKMRRPDLFDVTWYTLQDLQDDVFDGAQIMITDDLKVKVIEYEDI